MSLCQLTLSAEDCPLCLALLYSTIIYYSITVLIDQVCNVAFSTQVCSFPVSGYYPAVVHTLAGIRDPGPQKGGISMLWPLQRAVWIQNRRTPRGDRSSSRQRKRQWLCLFPLRSQAMRRKELAATAKSTCQRDSYLHLCSSSVSYCPCPAPFLDIQFGKANWLRKTRFPGSPPVGED